MISKELVELRNLTNYVVNNPDPMFHKPSRTELERAEWDWGIYPTDTGQTCWNPKELELQWSQNNLFNLIKYNSFEEFCDSYRIQRLLLKIKANK